MVVVLLLVTRVGGIARADSCVPPADEKDDVSAVRIAVGFRVVRKRRENFLYEAVWTFGLPRGAHTPRYE
jgi:hypothetical protein